MPGQTVEVRSEVFGSTPEGGLPPVVLQALDERVAVRELIRRTVEEQVRELLAQRNLDAAEARRTLDRHYLTRGEIAAGAKEGAIRYPKPENPPQVDPEIEVRKALRAFEDGAYFVLVDSRQMENLYEEIHFAPGTKVTFLRVMPLVGG